MPQHTRDPSANSLARGAASTERIEAARRKLDRAARFIRRKPAERDDRQGADPTPGARLRGAGGPGRA